MVKLPFLQTAEEQQALKEKILTLLTDSEMPLTRREVARQLKIRGEARVPFKHIMAQLEQEGFLTRERKRRLVPVWLTLRVGQHLTVKITDKDEEGEWITSPVPWNEDDVSPPRIYLLTTNLSFTVGDRLSVRLVKGEGKEWSAQVLRRLKQEGRFRLGLFNPSSKGNGYLTSCHRKDPFPRVSLSQSEAQELRGGDIVYYIIQEQAPKVLKRIGSIYDPKSFSLLAIHFYDLPHVFSEAALSLAQQATVPSLEGRIDLRDVDLVTIDGEDARDFDDAVFAASDSDPRNPGGWRLIVAIADVAHYVRSRDALDQEARKRGNSVYFPDTVVPMLPEALSNGLCSLKPGEDRACLVVEMIISAQGRIKFHHIKRGLMRSKARLTYSQFQGAVDGKLDENTQPLLETVIKPLFNAYQCLLKARRQRGTLDLHVEEYQVHFEADGHVASVWPRLRYKSHQLIEEFMIAANVAVAKTLADKGIGCLYRIHDTPDMMKLTNLRGFLKSLNLHLPKSKALEPRHFNLLLKEVQNAPEERLVHELILRCQSQACYSPVNIGHYGLNLKQYCHFTSPIRRYADLIVHRLLIKTLELGDDGENYTAAELHPIAAHISATERQAAVAERDTMDRFMTAHLAPHVGEIFLVTIVGVNNAGLFVAVNQSGAQGFIPKHSLGEDRFYYDEVNHRLVGQRTRKIYQLGTLINAILITADINTNSVIFALDRRGDSDLPSMKRKKDKTSQHDHRSVNEQKKSQRHKNHKRSRRRPKQ